MENHGKIMVKPLKPMGFPRFFFPFLSPNRSVGFFSSCSALALPLLDDSDLTVRQEAAPWAFRFPGFAQGSGDFF